mmetsp:Transcript_17665/g.35201  ORF Transcript_17665/g.35201 Transcript_17665/m.35201 type:complete len:153 (+) Transcript_17665:220-678(+)
MVYGSGTPEWANGKSSLSTPQNRRGNGGNEGRSNSYQNSYQAPNLDASRQAEQTAVMEDSLKTNYDAEGNAQTVLAHMTAQRHQLNSAHTNVNEMKDLTEKAKKELAELVARGHRQKNTLYGVIGALTLTDIYLFYRIVRCGGSFFCSYSSY